MPFRSRNWSDPRAAAEGAAAEGIEREEPSPRRQEPDDAARRPRGARLPRAGSAAPAAEQAVAAVVPPPALDDDDGFARTVLRSVRVGIVVFDRELRCRFWNPYMEDLTGIAADQVRGAPAVKALPSFTSDLEARLRRALGGETVQFRDAPLPDAAGGKRWVSGFFTPQVSPGGEILGVVAVVNDVTERKEAESRLARSASHDPLTGLPNRGYFMDRLRRSLVRSRLNPDYQFGVLFLDLDRFKVVNDSLGHLAGDRLLVQLALRLQDSVRPGDTVARLGGDEFGIIVYGLDGERDAWDIASRIQSRLEEPFDLDGRQFFTGASIGIALSSTGYDRPEEVLRDADLAMYSAKAEGTRGTAVFGRDMHEQAVAVLQLETDLRLALERNEFLLRYQPIVELATGRLTGFEALLRWRHPDQGLVSPGHFIDLAEETGLILPIGRWVLREACSQFKAWTGGGAPGPDSGVTMHINLSGKQFIQAEGIEEVTRVLEETGVDGRCVRLEITESVILENADAVAAALQDLRARGIGLSIDDFGTGYSSLSYLHRLPFDTLKIDRSFVSAGTGAGGRGGNLEIARAIISLAHHLGMHVVAEGIETPEQLSELRGLGCEYGQGYLLAGALEAAAALEFYRRHKDTPVELPLA